jgi:hypothetical protein
LSENHKPHQLLLAKKGVVFFMDYNYITSKAFLMDSKIKFLDYQYHAVGLLFSQAYKEKYGKEPEKILAINGKRGLTKPCSLYPIEFIETMQNIAIDYFANSVTNL